MGNYVSTIENQNINYRKYGWKPSLPDFRDKYLDVTLNPQNKVSFDLRDKCPKIYNQGKLGSCTANAIAFAYQFDEMKQLENKDEIFVPSRLFIYYNEREMEGTTSSDSGAAIRDGIKTINKIGVCPESLWPYDISTFTEKPNPKCYQIATKHKSIKYARIKQTLEQLREAITAGYPVVFGFTVYQSFESEEVAKTGIMPMPNKNERLLGGHAVSAVGFNETHFIIRNSWGDNWGKNGYFFMLNEFITNSNLANDFWVVYTICDK